MGTPPDVARLADLLPAAAWVPEDQLAPYGVQGRQPLVAVRPAGEDQAVAAMGLAAADAWGVVPWGGGTAQGRGRPPAQYDLCVSLERMNAVVDHQPQDMVATVQAGATLVEVQRVLGEQGQWWSIDPPDAGATVGGILATNRSGPRRALYGTARDHVIGMRVLHADGVVTKHGGKVVKNVAGFDLNKLHIGALGTLGIILEVSLKLRPVPTHETVIVSPFQTREAAARALATIAGSELQPTAVELLSAAAAQQIVPEQAAPAVALVGVEGPPTAVERQVKQVSAVCIDCGGGAAAVIDRSDVRRVWTAFRDLGRGPSDPVPLWCTLAALPEHVGDIAVAAETIASDHSQRLVLDARAANGVFRLGLLGEPQPVLAERVVTAWRELAGRYGGTLVVEEAPPDVRDRLDPWGPPREDFFLMEGLKQSLDPQRLLNPGRYVGGL